MKDHEGKLVHLQCIVWKQKIKQEVTFLVSSQYASLYFDYKAKTVGLDAASGAIFWQERRGKVHRQTLGRSWFLKYPKTMARWLGKENPDSYSGHSICHTGATIQANAGATISELKRYGHWKSSAVADSYVENSHALKEKTANRMNSALSSPLPLKDTTNIPQEPKKRSIEFENKEEMKKRRLDINSFFKDCTFNGDVEIKITQ